MNASISLHDTRTRRKAPFTPIDPANVRVYVCGPTVYDLAHIGNARPNIVFDVLFRVLRQTYGADHVTYVRNFTDVDDKINARAAERGISIAELADGTIAAFNADMAALGCLEPTRQPRATHHIADMRQMIDRLVETGNAYVAEDHVLFAVASMDDYGALSGRSLDEMMAGARVEVAPYKRDPMDFVLWKPSREGEPGWPSPAGIAAEGRPGWHIECSAMAHTHLGDTFDIHGGGIDLAFPHHENERAQTKSALGVSEMASVWMHNGFLQVEGRKMAKSEGNFITIRDALSEASGAVVRLAMLMTHYRQPIDWTATRLGEADAILKAWTHAPAAAAPGAVDEAVLAALADDLNTPLAIARLGELARSGADTLDASALLLGIDVAAIRTTTTAASNNARAAIAPQVEALIADRLAARADRRFADADRIRDEIVALGVRIMDGKAADGTLVTEWDLGG
ncbi:cysteine--tRNA ligase [Acuticoccus sp. MNP-M23]|uniref:cysteine--tRNA ligase n=1 Tax=Acuticoccus sp. MNP-M23 TaxID=3072793 RepID=UPI0028156CD2|nr:cysteine--tRNA ligase [Acuticoccus sp. MNP-M23]WMS42157.1 cysteine--tRNA ligase [Acuticoccus sp. MNP-M23]